MILGGSATPIGSRPTGPGSQCRLTKKIQMSTRPIQNCGNAMPLKVKPRSAKSGQRSRFTAINTPAGKIGTWNVGSYSNPKVDELTNKVEVEADPVKRQALISEALAIEKDDIGHIPLHQAGLAWGVHKGVHVWLRPDDSLELRWVTLDK